MKETLEENDGFFFHFDTFTEMEKAFEAMFGSGAAVIIATIAKPAGQRLCERIMEKSRFLRLFRDLDIIQPSQNGTR